jgi:tetratricopeptide (TPR) repeat protein
MWDGVKALGQARIDGYLGAYRESAMAFEGLARAGNTGSFNNIPSNLAYSHIGEHDVAAAHAAIATINPQAMRSNPAVTAIAKRRTEIALAAEMQDWSAVMAGSAANQQLIEKTPAVRAIASRQDVAILARAEAGLGRFAAAEARIAATPGDCYDCLWSRARIAALRDQHGRADYWFGRAVRDAPSYPFAYHEWGKALLERGQPDEAIAQFTLANQKGPHFADPLEGWGEALMAKNQSHRALAKFEEADKYAPNWGRLHLKWGQALAYAGKPEDANKQFARAAQLDLTPTEKSELARHGRL